MQDSRTYTHSKCGTQTTVDGPAFRAVSDPMAGMRTTYCSSCDDQFPVSEYVWSDTDELISDYYSRYRKNASQSDIWWCGNGGLALLVGDGVCVGILLGIGVGLLTNLVLGLIAGVVLAVAGAAGGLFVRETIFSPRITQRVCGVADTRLLR